MLLWRFLLGISYSSFEEGLRETGHLLEVEEVDAVHERCCRWEKKGDEDDCMSRISEINLLELNCRLGGRELGELGVQGFIAFNGI